MGEVTRDSHGTAAHQPKVTGNRRTERAAKRKRMDDDDEWRPNPEGDLDGLYSHWPIVLCMRCMLNARGSKKIMKRVATLGNEAKPLTDATITIRIIKSFTFRTEKHLILQHLDLKQTTVGQLKEIARKGPFSPSEFLRT